MQAVNAALVRMLTDLGDQAFVSARFQIQLERFRDLPQTTWLELEDAGYVVPVHAFGNPSFKLTGRGWIAALRAAGLCAAPDQREAALKLRTALKDIANGDPSMEW